MQPKISVIVPIYNVERYLDRCIQSVLNQTLKDIEIILVDDGSPDKCPAMCDEYAKKDGRIKVIHKKNGGLGFARNSGLEIATGEYVAFVDSDDFIENDMYDNLYREAKEYEADVVFSNVRFYTDGNVSIRKDVEALTVFQGRNDVRNLLLDMVAPLPESNRDVKYMASVWRAVYRLETIKQNAISFLSEREIVSEDLPFNIEFLKHSECAVYSDKAYYNYCYNSTSLSKTSSFAKYDRMDKLLQVIKEQLSSVFPKESYILHYQRYVLFVLRISLFGDWQICKSQGLNWNKQFNIRRSRNVYEDALKKYPIKTMPLKFMLFYASIKLGLSSIINILFTISEKHKF